ncbi:MAG: TerB family tellurite resistance protein [Gammaproteobacteria bacterium]|nr:TerB family tellurite resistance protein [Gammaproteobacteria bacterium]
MSNWLDQLKSILTANSPERPDDDLALPRAAAVLLLEVSATDPGGESLEARVIEAALIEHFGLGRSEAEALLGEAGRLQQDSVSMHEFTHMLKSRLDPQARAELVEWLWKVAYADGHLDRFEEHLIRRLADLLAVPHLEFIRRKPRAGPA